MTVISKQFFYERIDDSVKCAAVHYWHPNCLNAIFSGPWILNLIYGSAKFFLPLYLLKLLINYKKVKDVDFLKSLVVAELTSIIYGLMMGFLFLSSICLLRGIYGRIHYYNLVFIPGLVSGLSVLVESKENQILDTLIFFNSFVELTLRSLDYSNILKLTKTNVTLLFMTVSAMLMYCLENRTIKLDFIYFWFYTPPKRKVNPPNDEKSDKDVCSHPNSCYSFFRKGCLKYFGLGYSISIIRSLLPKFGILPKRPTYIFKILMNKANFKSGLFIGGYVGLYRVLTCYLLRTSQMSARFHGLIAGFLSGLTYAISPNIQVLAIAITTLLQIFYERISNVLSIKNHLWPRQLLFMVCHGALLHSKLLYPNICPTYYKNMIDSCSNDMTVHIYRKLVAKYLS